MAFWYLPMSSTEPAAIEGTCRSSLLGAVLRWTVPAHALCGARFCSSGAFSPEHLPDQSGQTNNHRRYPQYIQPANTILKTGKFELAYDI